MRVVDEVGDVEALRAVERHQVRHLDRALRGRAAVDERHPVVATSAAARQEHAAHHALVVELEVRDLRIEPEARRSSAGTGSAARSRPRSRSASRVPVLERAYPCRRRRARSRCDARAVADLDPRCGSAAARTRRSGSDIRATGSPWSPGRCSSARFMRLDSHSAGSAGVVIADLGREQRFPQHVERPLADHAADPDRRRSPRRAPGSDRAARAQPIRPMRRRSRR